MKKIILFLLLLLLGGCAAQPAPSPTPLPTATPAPTAAPTPTPLPTPEPLLIGGQSFDVSGGSVDLRSVPLSNGVRRLLHTPAFIFNLI